MNDRRRLIALLSSLLLTLACSSKAPAGNKSPEPGQAAAALQAPAPAPSQTPKPLEGQDFAEDARLLFRVAACGGDEALPPGFDATAVAEHCQWLAPKVQKYQKAYVEGAEQFIAALQPADLPKTVVYPFGGGDLLSALTTYPQLAELTTLSLEHAGDPRRLKEMDKAQVARSLAAFRKAIAGLLSANDSTSENLMQMERADIPGQLSFFMVGLAIHGYEPVSLRYFTVQEDGSLHYLSSQEIGAETKIAKKLNPIWVSPNISQAFSNMELQFRKQGVKDAPVRIHRHIAANLADQFLKKDARVLKHLEAKGRVSAMTKAASYLLWNAAFVKIRSYLLDNMVFMVSDSTGIPPRFATKAGFVQETYGRFTGPFLDASKQYSDEFVKLWGEQPYRALPFRYGYPEASKHFHMLVTKRAEAKGIVAK
jgi:hypothetical protein